MSFIVMSILTVFLSGSFKHEVYQQRNILYTYATCIQDIYTVFHFIYSCVTEYIQSVNTYPTNYHIIINPNKMIISLIVIMLNMLQMFYYLNYTTSRIIYQADTHKMSGFKCNSVTLKFKIFDKLLLLHQYGNRRNAVTLSSIPINNMTSSSASV